MSLTQQDREWFARRDTLNIAQRSAVEAAFDSATEAIIGFGLPASHDDTAASLEAAIVRYVVESRAAFVENETRKQYDALTSPRHDVDKA